MIPASARVRPLARLDDADVSLVPLRMGEFTAWTSLPEPWPGKLAAASQAGAVDFSGYYGPGRVASPARRQSWPWLAGLDPLVLVVHSHLDVICLTVAGQLRSVTDPVLGSLLSQLPALSVALRPLVNPLVVLTCTEKETHQALADATGRLVWCPRGWTVLGARPDGRGGGVRVVIGLERTAHGRGGEFVSVYPHGPAGDRVRVEYRRRFASSAVKWLVVRTGDAGSMVSTDVRPLLFGGGRFVGLSYFDRRDIDSRRAVWGSTMLAQTYVSWTPSHAYRPGTPAGTATASRPFISQELGELPFDTAAASVVVGYFADGRFAVYDQRRDVSYWETPLAFGQRLRKDLAAARQSASAPLPSRVLLVTDFAAVPAPSVADVARGSRLEVITLSTPATLFVDESPGHGGPQARIALLPATGDVTAPEWTSTTAAGVSTTLSALPVPHARDLAPGTARLRTIRYLPHVTTDQRRAIPARRLSQAGPQPAATAGISKAPVPSGALMRDATGRWIRRPAAVPTWAELETLARQTVQLAPADTGIGELDAAPGRQTGRCVALALAWRDAMFPGGIAATATADDLMTGRRGLLTGLVAAGGWVHIDRPLDVEDVLAARRGLYAMVVWEPAGQVADRQHGKVWHAHRAGPEVRWMDLETSHGQWMPRGGPPGFTTGRAQAVFISAGSRVLDPGAAARVGLTDLRVLLELAPARPVTGKIGRGSVSKVKETLQEHGYDAARERARRISKELGVTGPAGGMAGGADDHGVADSGPADLLAEEEPTAGLAGDGLKTAITAEAEARWLPAYRAVGHHRELQQGGTAAAVPIAHGVVLPRGDGLTLDHLAGKALRTYPGWFTVAAHPVAGSADLIWWGRRQVSARQFLGVVGRLPGYASAVALNRGKPPGLVLVICGAEAAGGGSFAAIVRSGYPGPVVAAASGLDQAGGGEGNVTTRGGLALEGGGGGGAAALGGEFVTLDDAGAPVGLGGELTGAMARLAGRQQFAGQPVPAIAVTPPQEQYREYVARQGTAQQWAVGIEIEVRNIGLFRPDGTLVPIKTVLLRSRDGLVSVVADNHGLWHGADDRLYDTREAMLQRAKKSHERAGPGGRFMMKRPEMVGKPWDVLGEQGRPASDQVLAQINDVNRRWAQVPETRVGTPVESVTLAELFPEDLYEISPGSGDVRAVRLPDVRGPELYLQLSVGVPLAGGVLSVQEEVNRLQEEAKNESDARLLEAAEAFGWEVAHRYMRAPLAVQDGEAAASSWEVADVIAIAEVMTQAFEQLERVLLFLAIRKGNMKTELPEISRQSLVEIWAGLHPRSQTFLADQRDDIRTLFETEFRRLHQGFDHDINTMAKRPADTPVDLWNVELGSDTRAGTTTTGQLFDEILRPKPGIKGIWPALLEVARADTGGLDRTGRTVPGMALPMVVLEIRKLGRSNRYDFDRRPASFGSVDHSLLRLSKDRFERAAREGDAAAQVARRLPHSPQGQLVTRWLRELVAASGQATRDRAVQDLIEAVWQYKQRFPADEAALERTLRPFTKRLSLWAAADPAEIASWEQVAALVDAGDGALSLEIVAAASAARGLGMPAERGLWWLADLARQVGLVNQDPQPARAVRWAVGATRLPYLSQGIRARLFGLLVLAAAVFDDGSVTEDSMTSLRRLGDLSGARELPGMRAYYRQLHGLDEGVPVSRAQLRDLVDQVGQVKEDLPPHSPVTTRDLTRRVAAGPADVLVGGNLTVRPGTLGLRGGGPPGNFFRGVVDRLFPSGPAERPYLAEELPGDRTWLRPSGSVDPALADAFAALPADGRHLIVVSGARGRVPAALIDLLRAQIKDRPRGTVRVLFTTPPEDDQLAGPAGSAGRHRSQVDWARQRVIKSGTEIAYPDGEVTPGRASLYAPGWTVLTPPGHHDAAEPLAVQAGEIYPRPAWADDLDAAALPASAGRFRAGIWLTPPGAAAPQPPAVPGEVRSLRHHPARITIVVGAGWDNHGTLERELRRVQEALPPERQQGLLLAVGGDGPREWVRQVAAQLGIPVTYATAGELQADLRAAVVQQPGIGADPAEEWLGWDPHGRRQPGAPPGFLAGYDWKALEPARFAALFTSIDLAGPRPQAASITPQTLARERPAPVITHIPADRKWAPDPNGELRGLGLDLLPEVLEFPQLIHSIWLGGPLGDSDKQGQFRANVAQAAARYRDQGWTSLLWTDVPRQTFELAETTPPGERDAELSAAWSMADWARRHGIKLINIHEVFSAAHPMMLHSEFAMLMAGRSAKGYTVASDILRFEIVRAFGGLYADGDDIVLEGLADDVREALTSSLGFGGRGLGPDPVAIPVGHPFAELYLDTVRRNFQVPQEQFLQEVRTPERPTVLGPWTRSFGMRTGVMFNVHDRAGLAGRDIPVIKAVKIGAAKSWREPIAAPAAPPYRAQTLEVVQDVLVTLLRNLVNRPGDLFLTAVAPVVDRLPDPDLAWRAVLEFLAGWPQVADNIQTATVLLLSDDLKSEYRVRLPDDVWRLLGIDAAQIGNQATATGARWLGAGLMMPVRFPGPHPPPAPAADSTPRG